MPFDIPSWLWTSSAVVALLVATVLVVVAVVLWVALELFRREYDR